MHLTYTDSMSLCLTTAQTKMTMYKLQLCSLHLTASTPLLLLMNFTLSGGAHDTVYFDLYISDGASKKVTSYSDLW